MRMETSKIRFAFLLALTLSLAGPAFAQDGNHDGTVDGTSDDDATAFCNNCGYQDDTDGGDDIWGPGCHWEFRNSRACARNKRFLSGDKCKDKKNLIEWTDSTCHAFRPVDKKTYDCDAECRALGFLGGSCIAVPNVCDGNKPSAKCVCIDPTKPTDPDVIDPDVIDGTDSDDTSDPDG